MLQPSLAFTTPTITGAQHSNHFSLWRSRLQTFIFHLLAPRFNLYFPHSTLQYPFFWNPSLINIFEKTVKSGEIWRKSAFQALLWRWHSALGLSVLNSQQYWMIIEEEYHKNIRITDSSNLDTIFPQKTLPHLYLLIVPYLHAENQKHSSSRFRDIVVLTDKPETIWPYNLTLQFSTCISSM